MTYTLAIGQRRYSSWSLRGWLLFSHFGIEAKHRMAQMYSPKFREVLDAEFAPARTVPAVQVEGLGTLWDTLAIAETLHERHPDAGLWPADAAARIFARSITGEMHSGFSALRDACPMNLGHSWVGFEVSDAVKADLARLEDLWGQARERFGAGGPWLFGEYCAADAFFAPVAARIAGYGLPVGPVSTAYVATHLEDQKFRQWRAMGTASGDDLREYDMDFERGPWPGPTPRAAIAVPEGLAENETCPYSGKPVVPEGLLSVDGRIIGFCNAFCRDKTAADFDAWPDAVALLEA